MTDITIPPEAVEAAFKSFTTGLRDTWREELEDAIRAAIAAWPGVATGAPWIIGVKNIPSIILPLPQKENSDE